MNTAVDRPTLDLAGLDLTELKKRLQSDAEFRLSSRGLTARLRLQLGGELAYVVSWTDGELTGIAPAAFFDPYDMAISAPVEVWDQVLAPEPGPFFQDLFAARARHGLVMEGDLLLLFAYYNAVRRLTDVLRQQFNGRPDPKATEEPPSAAPPPRSTPRWEQIVGRYLHLDVDGVEYRVYVEEAGQGIPLLCQHTAGADSRQWRHLLEDPEITSLYRVIAYDLPYHGRSLPPETLAWWAEPYRLSTAFFTGFVVAMARALDLDQPIYIGCSMGGHLAGDLALRYPDEFRAVIGIEGALKTDAESAELDLHFHPRVNAEYKMATMYTLCAPTSPEVAKREVAWIYGQGAPMAHRGDMYYYCGDHDLTATAGDIDTSKVAVHILSGAYDWSATPEESQQLAAAIPGARLRLMEGLGHFPMAENYPTFRPHLLAVLAEIDEPT